MIRLVLGIGPPMTGLIPSAKRQPRRGRQEYTGAGDGSGWNRVYPQPTAKLIRFGWVIHS